MKRCFSLFSAIMLLFVLCSCGKSADAELEKQGYMSGVCTKDSVNEFIAIVEDMQKDGLLSEYDFSEKNCYNVTPVEVAAETNIKIFKFSDSCASFALLDNKAYPICEYFGGYGFVNAVPCDFDNNGNKDLLVASSCGSGLHCSVISVFNTATKESTVVYNTLTDNSQLDLFVATQSPSSFPKNSPDLPNYYQVYSAEIKVNNNNLADLSYVSTGVVGEIACENGSPVFKAIKE